MTLFSELTLDFRPQSNEIKNTVRLFDAGMMMGRLNISHGTIKQNCTLVNKFKQAKRLRPHKTIGFMLEIKGKEIRLSNINDKSRQMEIKSGDILTLNCNNASSFSNESVLYCNNDVIQRYVKPNDVVNFNDGNVIAIVKETKSESLILECKIGGMLHS